MVCDRRRRHLPAIIPLARGEGEGSQVKIIVRLQINRMVALFNWKASPERRNRS